MRMNINQIEIKNRPGWKYIKVSAKILLVDVYLEIEIEITISRLNEKSSPLVKGTFLRLFLSSLPLYPYMVIKLFLGALWGRSFALPCQDLDSIQCLHACLTFVDWNFTRPWTMCTHEEKMAFKQLIWNQGRLCWSFLTRLNWPKISVLIFHKRLCKHLAL